MDRLIDKILEKQNPSVVGLDPKLEYIPNHIKEQAFEKYGKNLDGAAYAVLLFNQGIIDAVWDIVPAVKLQLAYYELFSWQGVRVYQETIAYARKKGLYVIADGKRNDIGSTMEAYAVAHLGELEIEGELHPPFDADSLTVNAYLGSDGIKPLLPICKERDRSVFVLVKTSNPSSGELQNQMIDTKPVYHLMGDMCEEWGKDLRGRYGYSLVGAVVGATYPQQLEELRRLLPHTFFLVPGYGAQGGSAQDIKQAFDKNGLGAIINSSRAVLTAWKKEGCPGEEFGAAARREAMRMREEITTAIPPMTR